MFFLTFSFHLLHNLQSSDRLGISHEWGFSYDLERLNLCEQGREKAESIPADPGHPSSRPIGSSCFCLDANAFCQLLHKQTSGLICPEYHWPFQKLICSSDICWLRLTVLQFINTEVFDVRLASGAAQIRWDQSFYIQLLLLGLWIINNYKVVLYCRWPWMEAVYVFIFTIT